MTCSETSGRTRGRMEGSRAKDTTRLTLLECEETGPSRCHDCSWESSRRHEETTETLSTRKVGTREEDNRERGTVEGLADVYSVCSAESVSYYYMAGFVPRRLRGSVPYSLLALKRTVIPSLCLYMVLALAGDCFFSSKLFTRAPSPRRKHSCLPRLRRPLGVGVFRDWAGRRSVATGEKEVPGLQWEKPIRSSCAYPPLSLPVWTERSPTIAMNNSVA